MRTVIVALAVAVGCLGASPARAQEGDGVIRDAAALFREGVARFDRDDFAGALESFTASYEARQNSALRFNIGVCHFNLRRWIPARQELSLYLAETDPSLVSDERRRQVEELLAQVDTHVGLVSLEVSDPGSTVSIDGTELGSSELSAPVVLEPGTHRLEVSLEGHDPFYRTIEVSAGQRTALNVVLVRTPEPPPPLSPPEAPPAPELAATTATPTEPPAPSRRRLSRAWFGVTTGVALSLALAGAITGSLAQAGVSNFDSEIETCVENNDRACSRAYSLADEIESLGAATTGLFVSTGVLAVAAFVLAFVTNWNGDTADEADVAFGLSPLADLRGGLSGAMLDAAWSF